MTQSLPPRWKLSTISPATGRPKSSPHMIHREVYREVPPKVEYSLTDIGRDFLPIIDDLERFANEYRRARAN